MELTPGRDRGSALVLTLVLTVVLGVIVTGLITHVSAALVASRVTDARTQSAATSDALVNWQIEELTHKRAVPCTTSTIVASPTALVPTGSTAVLRCDAAEMVDGHPTAVLTATTTTGNLHLTVRARVQVPTDEYVVHVLAWSVGSAT